MTQTARAHLAMLTYSALISASFSIGDRITDFLPPRLLIAERFVFGATVFAAIAAISGQLNRPSWRDVGRYTLLAGTMVGFFVLMFEALRHTDAVTTGALFTLLPLMTAITARVLVGQRTAGRQWLLIIVGAIGASFIVFDGDWRKALTLELGRGEWTFIAALASFSLYSPLVRRLHRGESAITLTLWTLIVGLVLLMALSIEQVVAVDWSEVPLRVHVAIAYLGIVNTAVTFMLAKYASTRIPAAKVMAYTFLTPVFVVLLEGVLGVGWPPPIIWLGLAVTAAATAAFAVSSDGTRGAIA